MKSNGSAAPGDQGDALQAMLDEHPFRAPWWLRSRHAQTVWSPLFRRSVALPWTRSRLTTPDGDHLSVHVSLTARAMRSPSGEIPLALLLHGLEGSVRSNYVTGLAGKLLARGFDVMALEFRSCDGETNVAQRLYHSGETSDLDWVVERLVAEQPGRRLVLHGVSLGGNVLLKWLGERGETIPSEVRAAAATSPPFDLVVSGPALDRALFGLYSYRFLRTLVPKALDVERRYPGCLDARSVRQARTIEAFDNRATAPLHGFDDAHDYWRQVSSTRFLPGIRRPVLLIAARDDPFNPASTHPLAIAAEQPYLVTQFPEHGGHVGFVYGNPWRTRHWAEEQVSRFLTRLAIG